MKYVTTEVIMALGVLQAVKECSLDRRVQGTILLYVFLFVEMELMTRKVPMSSIVTTITFSVATGATIYVLLKQDSHA